MRHAKLWLALSAAIGVLAACSADSLGGDSSIDGSPNPSGGNKSSDGGSNNDGLNAGAASQGLPTSDGVLLVHSASFPAYRLCFSGYLGDVPYPDANVMPESNVVGVEMGSLVRIDPLTNAPGTVYIIKEKSVRNANQLAVPSRNLKCRELIGGGGNALAPDDDYVTAAPLTAPVGVDRAEVLAVTGCGRQSVLDGLEKVPGQAQVSGSGHSESCGDDWDDAKGNLKVSVVALETSKQASNDQSIPVQLFDLSPAADALKQTLTVDFGPSGNLGPLPVSKTFEAGAQTSLAVDQTDVAVYGQQEFVLTATPKSGAPATVTQSLADVQQLSSPNDTPTTYYRTASNYALLVLGDPSHQKTLDGTTPNPVYNPRRALHLLAVPVLDPSKIDAGADAGDGGSLVP